MDYPSDSSVGLVGGKFTDGDPANNIPASRDPAAWANAVSDELLELIKHYGLTPDENVLTQVRQAVGRAAGRAVTVVTAAESPKALTVAEAGLVVADTSDGAVELTLPAATSNSGLPYTIKRSGANGATVTPDGTDTIEGNASLALAADDTRVLVCDGGTDWKRPEPIASEALRGMLEIAADAEAQAFTAGKAIDGAKLAIAFQGGNQSLTANGYQKLPGGFILQWAAVSGTTDTDIAWNFPVTFPNQPFIVGGSIQQSGATQSGVSCSSSMAPSQAGGVTVRLHATGSPTTGLVFAIGC